MSSCDLHSLTAPVNASDNSQALSLSPQAPPLLSNKYLRNLRKKCTHWIEDFGWELTEKNDHDYPVTNFEKTCRLSKGKPFMFDDGNMRSLHFDKRTMQSAMWVEAPDELAFGYTRCMMGFLLSNNQPKHILMVGLGGGSLVKYCHKYLPQTRITVLEIDDDVIALRDKFSIPADDHRLQIIHADAVQYVAQAEHKVDVILLDGFDSDGLAAELITDEFFSSCKNMLSQEGVLVTNMWGQSEEIAALLGRMYLDFDREVWWCRSIDSFNLVSFAFQSADSAFRHDLKEQALRLDLQYRLEMEKLVGRLQTIHTDQTPAVQEESLLRYVSLETISKQIRIQLVQDELLVRSRLEWMENKPY
jgi:spermidine synthase